METTIQISKHLQETLQKKKFVDKESYEEVIWSLIEDSQELSEETKREITESRKQAKEGKVKTLDQIKKELDL